MDIHLSYYLAEHGWSDFWIYTESKEYSITITHVFQDPIEECIRALLRIIKGEKIAEFFWHGEPGGERITIKELPTQQHMVKVNIESFSESYGDEIKEYSKEIDFEIKKTLLVTMFYYEFKKIAKLLKDKHYNKDRNSSFDFRAFRLFEQSALEYLN